MRKLSFAVSLQSTQFTAVAGAPGSLDFIDDMAAMGFDGIELAIRKLEEIDQTGLESALARTGLMLSALGTGQAYVDEGISFSDPNDKVRQEAVSRIHSHSKLAAGWGAAVIVGLIRGQVGGGTSKETNIERITECLRECCNFADTLDVDLVIEPINRYECDFLNSVPETLDFIDSVGHSRLKLLADTFHMNIEDRDIGESLVEAGPLLRHVHIADSNRHFPGRGHIDFGTVLDALSRVGYAGFLSGEMMPEPSVLAAMEGFVDYFRQT